MAPDRYPNFRRAQRERGPYHRGRRRQRKKQGDFLSIVLVSSASLFILILFGDQLPGLMTSTIQDVRHLGRDHAPPAGAYYSGCHEARAAGVAPIHAGEPGYREEMDGDGDGIACEPYRGM